MTDIVNNEITFYVNFFETPFIIPVSGSLDLKNIAFCSKKGNPKCTEQDITIKWGSAYYNNIRIWDIQTASIEVIQGYHSKMYSETLKSLVLYYPLTISYLHNNKIKNIISTLSEHFTITILSTDSMYNVDNIILYNYSSKFDWGLLNSDNFVSSMNGAIITSTECVVGCKRRYANDTNQCYECNTGYVLIFQK